MSPDGQYIVFDAFGDDPNGEADGSWELWLYSVKDNSTQRLTQDRDDD